MGIEKITEDKEEIVNKAVDNDKKSMTMTLDMITDYFEFRRESRRMFLR